MLKRILSLAVVLCAMLCALPATLSGALAAGADTYYLEVDIANQITTAYRKSDMTVVRQMICSTGTGSKTPRGTFKLQKTRESTDRKPWYWISTYHCYVKYATRIKGGILFHSIPYTDRDMASIDREALAQLGSKASHGCVRLRWQDAMWIAMNCPDGTTVKIFDKATRKDSLRRLLLQEGYTAESGMTYDQFIATNYVDDGSGSLGRGAEGEAVNALQKRLIGLGFFSGEATGVYDSATIMAVMRYQSAANMTVTGVASPALVEKIMTDDSYTADYSTLVPGVSGPLVANLQQAMRDILFYDGPVSGTFDAELSRALERLAQVVGIGGNSGGAVTPEVRDQVNGLLEELNDRYGAGKFSLAILDETFRSAAAAKKTSLYKADSTSSKVLAAVEKGREVTLLESGAKWCRVRVGDRTGYMQTGALKITESARPTAYWGRTADEIGADDMDLRSLGKGVVALKQRLAALGFFVGDGESPLYDDATAEAVEAYQVAAGAKVTGKATAGQQLALFASDEITGTRIGLKRGMTAPAVATLQRALKALQYHSGKTGGRFDSATAKAVKLFTRVNGMEETTEATPEVQRAVLDQYLDCEATYGSGNYILSITRVETPLAAAKSKLSLYGKPHRTAKTVATLARGEQALVLKRGESWTRLSYGGKTVYARTQSLKFTTRVDEVAEFNAPETPAVSAVTYGAEEAPEDFAVAAPEIAEDVFNGIAVVEYEPVAEESEEAVLLPSPDAPPAPARVAAYSH